MTVIRVHGTTDPDVIAVVVALLGRTDRVPPDPVTGLAAWQRTRRDAVSGHLPRRPGTSV